MVWRGFYDNALSILESPLPSRLTSEEGIEKASLEGIALAHLHQFTIAEQRLRAADIVCGQLAVSSCGALIRAKGILATERGDIQDASRRFTESLNFARSDHDQWLETTALLNLAYIALQREQNDLALEWSREAYLNAREMGAGDLAERASGNLGWAYFELGDRDQARDLFVEAERDAAKFGNLREELKWLTTEGRVDETNADFSRASASYREALVLARKIDSKEDIVNSLESLAHVSIEEGKLDDAEGYLSQLEPLIRANSNRLDALDVMLAQGRIATARQQDQHAESLFRQVEADPASQITMRLGAEHELGRLYEAEGRGDDAQKEYVTALGRFEAARDDIKNENSKLPYFANAVPIYDDSIRLLLSQGKSREALEEADTSRARTLEQGLGLTRLPYPSGRDVGRPNAGQHSQTLRPEAIAGRAGATLLFYWLGEKQSWLWAITPRTTQVFPLPGRAEIGRTVERYRRELQGPEDPLRARNEDGRALYRILVAPAKDLIAPGGKVVILCDGALSELNFETLLIDGAKPHYWIEDAEVVVGAVAAHGGRAKSQNRDAGHRRLLLVGDAVSPGRIIRSCRMRPSRCGRSRSISSRSR